MGFKGYCRTSNLILGIRQMKNIRIKTLHDVFAAYCLVACLFLWYATSKFLPYWGKSNVDVLIIALIALSLLCLYASFSLFTADKSNVYLLPEGIGYQPINRPNEKIFVSWSEMHSCWVSQRRKDGVEIKLNDAIQLKSDQRIFKQDGDKLLIVTKLLKVSPNKLYKNISDGIHGRLL